MKKRKLLFAFIVISSVLLGCNGTIIDSNKNERKNAESIALVNAYYQPITGFEAVVSATLPGGVVTYEGTASFNGSNSSFALSKPSAFHGLVVLYENDALTLSYNGETFELGTNLSKKPINLMVQCPKAILKMIKQTTPVVLEGNLVYVQEDFENIPNSSCTLVIDGETQKPKGLELVCDEAVVEINILSFETK